MSGKVQPKSRLGINELPEQISRILFGGRGNDTYLPSYTKLGCL